MAVAGDIHDAIRALFREELADGPEQWDADGKLPAEVFERLTEIGAFDARWPADGGGAGDVTVSATLARESTMLSGGAATALSVHTEGYLPAFALTAAAREGAAPGIGSVAVSEATGGSDVANCATSARRDGDDGPWTIDGHKHYVSNFPAATDCVVFARTGDSGTLNDYTLFVVPTTAPGVSFTPHSMIGVRAAGTSMVDFDGVEVDDSRRAGPVGAGLRWAMSFLRRERLWSTVAAAGVAELVCEAALAYASQRNVGGGPLREHQAIAHRLVDMQTEAAAAQALADQLVASAVAGRLTAAGSAAGKLFATRVCCAVADEAVQIMGGRGYTDEAPMSRIWRDSRAGRIGGGVDEILREQIARTQRPGALASHPVVTACAGAATSGIDLDDQALPVA